MSGKTSRASRVILASLFVALAGCGGGGDDSAPAPEPAPQPGTVKSISLVAGGGAQPAGACGDIDGNKAEARLGNVRDLAIANDGTVYVLEGGCQGGSRVRSISATGDIKTMAVNDRHQPPQSMPSFTQGDQLAIGDGGALYLRDSPGYWLSPSEYLPGKAPGVWKITSAGAQPFAGTQAWSSSPVDGVGIDARFDSPYHMVFGEGALWVLDTFFGARRITEDAVVTTVQTPLKPDKADNKGNLYQFVSTPEKGIVGLKRFDGREYSLNGLQADMPFVINGDGTVYGNAGRTTVALARTKSDGTLEELKAPEGGEVPSWVTLPYTRPAAMQLDRIGNLYVAHGWLIWKISFHR